MKFLAQRYIVKIPAKITVFYCKRYQIIIFSGPLKRKTLKLKTELIIENSKKVIKVTRKPIFTISSNERKKLKILQGTYVALFKQAILEVSNSFCKKLQLIGVGYRVFPIEILNNQILHFKLGYSHHVYFKIPENLTIFCIKSTKLFIIGNSNLFVSQIAALIRSYKKPEPYKGKGILYTTETVVIKEGKKV